jgi:hypothetical protein
MRWYLGCLRYEEASSSPKGNVPRSASGKSLQWFGSILLAVCAFGCAQPQPVEGIYSGHFDWQNGLKTVKLTADSYEHHPLDLRNNEIRGDIESIIQEQVKRANVQSAQGTITLSILGRSPFLVSIRRFEINDPDFSALRAYAESGDVDGISRFIQQHHNVNQRELPNQNTALFYAAGASKAEAVRVLLTLGADPNIVNSDGDAPLAAAAMADCVEALHLLIQAGANINQRDHVGITPLMWAIWRGKHRTLEELLKSGANPNIVSAKGDTALRIAGDKGDQATIAILKKFGASQ